MLKCPQLWCLSMELPCSKIWKLKFINILVLPMIKYNLNTRLAVLSDSFYSLGNKKALWLFRINEPISSRLFAIYSAACRKQWFRSWVNSCFSMDEYDEVVTDNPFYKAFQSKAKPLYNLAASNRWLVSIKCGLKISIHACSKSYHYSQMLRCDFLL